jgi:hypothetical protein
MTLFFVIQPEVPGGFGERTELLQRPRTYPIVKRLHFEFSYGTRGNDLITCHPVFMATKALAESLRGSRLSGFSLSQDIEVSVDPQVWELEPDFRAPVVEWLQVTGIPGSDDFGLTQIPDLVVSAAALAILKMHNISDGEASLFG